MTSVFSTFPFSRGGKGRTQAPPGAKANEQPKISQPGSWILADADVFTATSEMPEPADLRELNEYLLLLTEIFPDVQAEVFREMLLNISKQSRIEIVTEHLLKDKGKWVKGRYKSASTEPKPTTKIAHEQTFRSAAYRDAVKDAFYSEFKGLSHASIKAVLAEHNYSYTNARPVLQHISSKSWRSYISKLWIRQPKASNDTVDHPLVNWHVPFGDEGPRIPYLRHTLSHELNVELYNSYVAPLVQGMRTDRTKADAALALELNEQEAQAAHALFDCECCYDSVPFERVTACNTGAHFICQACIRSTMKEALFGQGWARTVDLRRGTIRCLASDSDENGCSLPADQVRGILTSDNDGEKIWTRFEDQLATRNLEHCRLPLGRCPFCPYAEIKEQPDLILADVITLAYRLAKVTNIPMSGLGGLTFWILVQPLLLIYVLLWIALYMTSALFPGSFTASHDRIILRKQGYRFQCRSHRCSIASCRVCSAKWTDPHICYETTTNSLRHAIEAATTAVVKRTCPRCNTSFVKSTGCNKLVCPCGYAMCYICRSAIGGEGYAHFCQHFRAQGGRCHECNRCDLYAVEDEEAIVRQAAQQAEKDWRRQQGMPQVSDRRSQPTDKLGLITEEVIRGSVQGSRWSLDDALDVFVEFMLA